MNRYISTLKILGIGAVGFMAGIVVNNTIINTAALSSIPFLGSSNLSTHTCIDQKCVAVSNQCTTDNNCATHTECDSSKKCVTVDGVGINQCKVSQDCLPIKDPQKWCETNNVSPGMKAIAIVYPSGNFSCDCYYVVSGTHSETTCKNSHLQ